MKIQSIEAYPIFDSRGIPTLEVEVRLNNGVTGRGLVPSGASTGQFEALELRDGDPTIFRGKSVYKAIANVNEEICNELHGQDVNDQQGIDETMIALDGSPNKSRLGANAILGVSMAVANAAARANNQGLYDYLSKGKGTLLPLPEIQIIGGGAHANWRTDIQDYLIVPTGAHSYSEALEIGFNVYHAAGDILRKKGKYFGLADEGGYWPSFAKNEEPLDLILQAIERAGYTPGKEASISLDIASSDLYDATSDTYIFGLEKKIFSSQDFTALMIKWCEEYPIISLEDPLHDADWKGWQSLNKSIGHQVQIIGDDLFTTNPTRIQKGIVTDSANSVLIKLNQIGTVSETLQAIAMTQAAGWLPVISARSGETEDSFISHLAVATNAGQLKVGSFARSERMAKWNECLRIERQLGRKARFEGARIYNTIFKKQ